MVADLEQQRERHRERSRRYRERNRDLVRVRDRDAKARERAADPDKNRAASRKWRSDNPDRARLLTRESGQRYRDKNRDMVREVGRRAMADWSAANPERRRAISHRHNLKVYGLTPESYGAMVTTQNGGCAICGATSPGRKGSGRLLIDHCHDTGVVRGLLCHPCNAILGYAKDSADRLRAAADYLERSEDFRSDRDTSARVMRRSR